MPTHWTLSFRFVDVYVKLCCNLGKSRRYPQVYLQVPVLTCGAGTCRFDLHGSRSYLTCLPRVLSRSQVKLFSPPGTCATGPGKPGPGLVRNLIQNPSPKAYQLKCLYISLLMYGSVICVVPSHSQTARSVLTVCQNPLALRSV